MERDKEIKNINIEEIIPNRFQPRLSFEPEALKELAESIKQYGVFQPLVVRRVGNKYEIIAGERRYKASTQAGFKEVPCVIVDLDDNESAEIALVENLQRKDLTALEEAKSYQKLLERGYINQDQLAKRMGKSQSNIANKIRLLNLDEEVQQALLESKISERHARSLLSIKDNEVQKELLQKIISKRMTVRDTDAEVKRMLNEDKQTLDFIPIRPDKTETSVVQNIEEPNPNELPIDQDSLQPEIISETEVDIEKLIKSTPEENETPQKPDIMDLLRVEEVKTYEQSIPTPSPVEEIEETIEEIPSVPGDQIPTIMENPLPEVLLKDFSTMESGLEQPISFEPTLEDIVQPEPVVEQPISFEPTLEDIVQPEPVEEQPIAFESPLEDIVQPEPVVEQPTAFESPLDDNVQPEPVIEQPTAFEPTLEDMLQPVTVGEQIIEEQQIEPTIPIMGQNNETPFIYDNPQQPNGIVQEEPIINQNQQLKTNLYVTNNLRTAINAARDCVNTIEKFGFIVEKEELDLPDSYQIIMTIAKTDV